MQAFSVLARLVVIVFLGLIAYNTGTGKTLPVHHPSWMSCDGLITRSLFYRLLIDSDELADVVADVKEATTLDEVDNVVTAGTNIDAARTLWFKSATEPGACQAKVYLQNPNKEGNNTAYVEFEIRGFAQADASWIQGIIEGTVLESVHLSRAGVAWLRE